MNLYTVADWSVVVSAFVLVSTVVGLGLGQVFALMKRLDWLEGWAGSVTYELVSQEQELELRLLRQHIDDIEVQLGRQSYELSRLSDEPESVVE